MNLTALENQRIELQQKIAAEKSRHEVESRKLTASLAETTRLITASSSGLNIDLIKLAESVMEVSGSFEKAGEDRQRALLKAIDDLATGAQAIKKSYFGTKMYARWHGQYVECSYGYGPSHGHVIFSIGLRSSHVGQQLSAEEIDACLYYLRNLTAIQSAAKTAA